MTEKYIDLPALNHVDAYNHSPYDDLTMCLACGAVVMNTILHTAFHDPNEINVKRADRLRKKLTSD